MNDVTGESAVGAPPDDISIKGFILRGWGEIFESWRNGSHDESAVDRLEAFLEHHRGRLFDREPVDCLYDWKQDWQSAKSLHECARRFFRVITAGKILK